MHSRWFPAVRDGLTHAGAEGLLPDDMVCAFYGDLFRTGERVLSPGSPWYETEDVDHELDLELLALWWNEAARVDPAVAGPHVRTLARTPRSVQAALNALSNSRFFAGLADRFMIAALRQVRRYLTEPGIRALVRRRLVDAVTADSHVLVAHSLGSVVAYEVLCAHPELPVRTLVTIGSPLGIRNVIFDRLRPDPGQWPGSVVSWTNLADEGDVVALVKDLRPLFGERVESILVNCGAKAHDATRYLTSKATGRAIAEGLSDG